MSENISKKPTVECLLSLWDCRSLAAFLTTQDINPDWLFAGFKPETASLAKKPVRKRLAREMGKRKELLLAFLRSRGAPWNEQQAILEVLDEDCLLLAWRALLRNPRHCLALVAALAGDVRPRVAARALRLVRNRHYPWRINAGEAEGKPALIEVVERMLFPQTAAELTEGEPSLAASGGKMKALQRQLEQANASNARLKKELRELKTRCEKLAANEQAGDKDLKRELTRLKSELASLCESGERRSAARLAAQRARIFGVDGAFERLRLAARTPAADDLVAKTEAVLAAQAKLDVKYGTVHALSRERERLLALLDSLDLASHNSIQPLPELNKTRREVAARIDYLNKLLTPASVETENVVAEELREAIVASSRSEEGMRQLNEAAALLHGSLAEHLLAENEKNALLKTVAERKKWIGLLTREHSLAESLHELAGGKAPNADAPAADIWDMAFELRRSEVKPILLIDGYNALKSTAALAAVETREGMPAARKKLLDRLLANSDSFSAIRLVYDGRGAVGTRERYAKVEIVFARERGQGQHADDEIVDWLSTGKPGDVPVWLATNDYGLRHRANRLCAGILAVEDLASFLRLS